MILKEQDETTKIYIVSSGCMVLYTEQEGNEFIVEKLYQGAILNHRVLFTDDQMHLNVRA